MIFLEALGTLVMPPYRTSISGSKSSRYKATFDAQMNRYLFPWTPQSLNFILTRQTVLAAVWIGMSDGGNCLLIGSPTTISIDGRVGGGTCKLLGDRISSSVPSFGFKLG